MEIVYSIFIGINAGKIAIKIAGIGLQCRRDRGGEDAVAAGDKELGRCAAGNMMYTASCIQW